MASSAHQAQARMNSHAAGDPSGIWLLSSNSPVTARGLGQNGRSSGAFFAIMAAIVTASGRRESPKSTGFLLWRVGSWVKFAEAMIRAATPCHWVQARQPRV